MEKSSLIEDIAVFLDESEKLVCGVVLIFDICNEASATELRKDFTLEGGEYLRHVPDLGLPDCGIAVHRKDAEDEFLVFDI